MEKKENFYFNYHHDYCGNRHVFKVYSKEPFNNSRKKDYEKEEVFDGDIIEHRLAGFDDKYDPRIYAVVKSYDGKAYAVSFNDSYLHDKITAYEGLPKESFVDTKIIPIDELSDDYELVTSEEVADGFSGPSNRKYEPYTQCHNYIGIDTPMYEVDEMYLVVMRITAYYYSIMKKGGKALVIASDSQFLHKLECSSFGLFNHIMYNQSKYDFRRVSGYNPGVGPIILCTDKVAKEYEKAGYEVLYFVLAKNENKKGNQRGRKKNNDRH